MKSSYVALALHPEGSPSGDSRIFWAIGSAGVNEISARVTEVYADPRGETDTLSTEYMHSLHWG